MRLAITLALALLVSLSLQAQKNKRPNYKLLWKISGNGLTKPSYLFGTMHVQDNQAFNLNDSVIAKIIQCDAFAMEVHPDSITRFMAQIILDENKDKNKTIESQMTAKEFRHYDSLLKKKTGLSLKKFKTIKQANYFLQQRNEKKDKNTFLDAWLYNIARERGKEMAGLENLSVQMKLLQDNDSTELSDFKMYLTSDADVASSRQTLYKLYFEGDVEALYRLMKEHTPTDKFKAMIIDRNIDMTNNMIGEMHKHSLFSAVGAGHLGGDIGIVNLLKQKGYTVTPVNADFSGTASKYKSSGSTGKWYTFKSEDDGYTVEMPNAPVPLEMPGLPFKFQTYLDIGTLSFYMVAPIPLGGVVEDQAIGKALDRMTENMSKSQKVSGVKKILIDGREGRELETQVDGNTFKVKVTIRQSSAYMMMAGPSKESANSNEAKRFFASLKLMTPAITKAEGTLSKEGAFSVNMPGKVTKQVNTPTDPTSGKPININMLVSANNTGETFFVRYNDFPVSYVSLNDSTYFYSTLNAVYARMGGVNLEVKDQVLSGYPAKHFSFLNADRTIGVEGVLTMRGERFYMLMNTNSPKEPSSPASREFYSSFRFIPFEEPVLKEVSFPEGFTLNVPSNFEADSIMSKTSETQTMYSFLDRNSGMMFLITTETFSKYDEYESPEKFFKVAMEKYLADKKGTFVKDSTVSSKFPVRDFVYKPASTNAVIKMRCEVAGSAMVTVWAYVPPNEQSLKLPEQVLGSLKMTPTSDWNLFSDKLDKILEGLSLRDSVERAIARTALYTYDFRESQLPKVYKAIRMKYDDDNDLYSIKESLLDVLNGKGGKATQAFIEELYPSLSDTTRYVDKAVGVMMSLKTKESVRKAMDLMLSNKSEHKFSPYTVLNPLNDSLALFDDVVPDVLNRMSMFTGRGIIFEMLQTGLDSNTFSTANRELVISKLTEIATEMANEPEGSRNITERYYMLVALYSVPFTPQVEALVRKFLSQESEYRKFLCFRLLLKNNAKMDSKDINSLAADQYQRLSVYEELKTYKKENLIDKKWVSSKMLAESEVYQYISDDDEVTPAKIKLLKEKTVIEDGKKKKILVYTFDDPDNDVVNDQYIAVAGTYDSDAKEFTRGQWTGTIWESYTNDRDLNARLKEYLEQFDIKLVE